MDGDLLAELDVALPADCGRFAWFNVLAEAEQAMGDDMDAPPYLLFVTGEL